MRVKDEHDSDNAAETEQSKRLSARAARKDGAPLTEAEIEEAEAEAEAWARRVNSC